MLSNENLKIKVATETSLPGLQGKYMATNTAPMTWIVRLGDAKS